MLKIRNRYDRNGNIITPEDMGKRPPPEGFMELLIELYTPISQQEEKETDTLPHPDNRFSEGADVLNPCQ